MSQRSFIAGARSLNEQDLHENLAYFKVPQAVIESIRSKLAFKISMVVPKDSDVYDQTDSVTDGPMPPLITSLQAWPPNNIRLPKEKEKMGVG